MQNLTRFVAVVFMLSLLVALPARAEDSPWLRKLPFENATISYAISGSENGTETLYIKDYGRYRAKRHEGTGSMFGVSMTTSTLEITDPDWHYRFDLVKKRGTKVTNPAKYFSQEYNKLTAAEKKNVRKNTEELGLSMVQDFQGETVPKASKILGYECDRTTIMGMTIFVIHQTDVPLRTEMHLMGMNTTSEATAFDKARPADDVFALPAGITPDLNRPADEATRQMAENMVNTLKEPDGAAKLKAQWSTGTASQGNAPASGEMDAAPGQAGGMKSGDQGQPGMPPGVENALKGLFGK